MKGIDRKVILSGMLGNGLEWYDYALYGQMTYIFSKQFFPLQDQSLSLIITFLPFALSFIARPLGAVFFGRIGDKFGRKKALVASMILMAIPTCAIGLLPTYQSIGLAAPLLLCLIRLLQGLSLGGAFSGSMSYIVEHAPPNRRATAGSLTILSLVIGFLLGSLVASGIASAMSEADFNSWGWRLPFIAGMAIGFVGFWIRNHGAESPVYEKAKAAGAISQSPVKDAFKHHPGKMLQGFTMYMFVTVPFYMLAIYMITYSKAHLGLSQTQALEANALAMIAMFIPLLPSAMLADRIGRRKVLLGTIIAMLVVIYPCFHLMQEKTFVGAIIGQCVLAGVLSFYLAPIPAVLVELFPTRVRYTGMALSYNFCAIIGGFTPMISEWLIRETGDIASIAWILVGAGAISAISLFTYKDQWQKPLTA